MLHHSKLVIMWGHVLREIIVKNVNIVLKVKLKNVNYGKGYTTLILEAMQLIFNYQLE